MPKLIPIRFGDIPKGLSRYHYDFLANMKHNIDILIGAIKSTNDAADKPPGSQAVTFDDLKEFGLLDLSEGGDYSADITLFQDSLVFSYFLSG